MKLKKYQKVAESVRSLVDKGVLNTGDQIPSVREMAARMKMSMMTVLEGYKLLEDEGLIESKPQSGYFVRPVYLRTGEPWQQPPPAKIVQFPLANRRVMVSDRATYLARNASRMDAIPLGAGFAAPEFFPCEELSLRVAKAIRNHPEEVNTYNLSGGHPRLKKELARRMFESGCETYPEDIVVTAGASQALLLAVKSLCKPGDSVAVESPGYYGFYNILEYLDLNAVEIPSDPIEGISLEAVEEACWNESVKCLLTSANLANPTGATVSDENKEKLVNICTAKRVPVVEDDTYGELVFEGRRCKSLKSFSEENVIYIGSLSKTLAPGYRIGWLAPGDYLEGIQREYSVNLFAANLPGQLGLAEFLRDKGLTYQLKKVRSKLKENMALFQREIARSFPEGTEASSPQGGHFLWISLPEGVSSESLANLAMKEGISIAPGLLFSSQQTYERFFRINTGISWCREVEAAMQFLGRKATELMRDCDTSD
jgi:DNA-binding transcriptional MocR family regulator